MSRKNSQKISSVAITANEASGICSCAEALLKVCDEVVIVGSVATKTTSIASLGLLDYYSSDSYGDLLHKTNKFSNRAAYLMFSDPTTAVGAVVALIHGISAFLKKYIVKGGMFHSMDGLVIASDVGLGSFIKYVVLYEYRKNKSRPLNPWG